MFLRENEGPHHRLGRSSKNVGRGLFVCRTWISEISEIFNLPSSLLLTFVASFKSIQTHLSYHELAGKVLGSHLSPLPNACFLILFLSTPPVRRLRSTRVPRAHTSANTYPYYSSSLSAKIRPYRVSAALVEHMVQAADPVPIESRNPKVRQSLPSHCLVSAPRHIWRKVGHPFSGLPKLCFFVVKPQGVSHLVYDGKAPGGNFPQRL